MDDTAFNSVSQIQSFQNVEWYKAQQLERYHSHLERMRESYSSESRRLKTGCNETVERIRENCIWMRDGCTDKMGKIRHKTSGQMERFREGASNQVLIDRRICDNVLDERSTD